MTQVRIVTDSGSDLSADAADRLGITIVPLVVRFGQEVYLDGQLPMDEFWQKVSESTHPPSTSQPAMGIFEETFARLVGTGHLVLCLTLTSKHSGTFSTAWAAAQRFGDRVRVMDTLSLSLGQGFQVLAAAKVAAKGLELDRIVELVEWVRERTRLFILLDTIEYIRRGGRADVLIPVLDRVASMLKIKPILRLVDGQLSLHSLVRSYKRGLTQIQQEVARLRPVESLAVIHVRGPEVAKDMAYTLTEKLDFFPEDVVVTETGPALSTHGGPRAVGVVVVQQTYRQNRGDL